MKTNDQHQPTDFAWRAALESLPQCVAFGEAARDEGAIVDIHVVFANAAARGGDEAPSSFLKLVPGVSLKEWGDVIERSATVDREFGGVRVRGSAHDGGVLATWDPCDAPDAKSMAESRAVLAAIVDSTDDAVIGKTLDGMITSWNSAAERIFGFSATEAIGQHISLIVPEELIDEEREILAQLGAGQRIEHFETVRLAKGGERLNLSLTISPIRDGQGRIVGASNVARDITMQKRVKRELASREAELHLITTATPVALVRVSADLRFRFVNRAAAALVGLTTEQMLNKRIEEVVGAEAFEILKPRIDRVLSGESVEFEEEIPYSRIGRRWVRVNYIPDSDQDGEVVGWMASVIDVSARHRAEEALRRSEERFRDLANNIDQFAWTCDRLGQVTWYNQQWYDYTGTTFDEMQGWGWRKVHHPDHLDRVVESIRQASEQGKAWEDVFPLRAKDGSYRWFLSRARPIRNEAGEIVRWFGTNTDMTKHRLAEERLRESERRLRLALRGAGAGVWLLDLVGNEVYWSEECCKLYGVDASFKPTYESWLMLVHPDDRESIGAWMADLLIESEETEYRHEFRILHPSREERWILDTGRIDRDADGTPVRMTGINIDITERKRHEERLQLVMAELNHRVKNTLAVIQSIASQTLRRATDLASFKLSFERRLRSIANAHSLLTMAEWEGAALHDIIASEIDSNVGIDHRSISGPAVMLRPQAALAMHMVIHELTTNACKYGALRGGGSINISWTVESGRLSLEWMERCEHRVTRPTTGGFGTRLIEQAVTHDLHGTVEYLFEPEGLQSRIAFPLDCREKSRPSRTPEAESASVRVLVVEDNATLAMGLCEDLVEAGYQAVGPAATVAEAISLAKGPIDAVLLDVNLDGTPSYPVARMLRIRGVPFVLLTGYSASDLPEELQDVPVLSKPANTQEILDFVSRNCPQKVSAKEALDG